MIQLPALSRKGFLYLPDALLGLLHLGSHAAGAVLLPPQFLFNPGNVGGIVLLISPEDGKLSVQLLMGSGKHIHLHPKGFQLPIPAPKLLTQLLSPAVEAVQVVMGLLQHEGRGSIVLFRLFRRLGQFFQGVQPDGDLHPPQLVLKLQIFFRFF